MKILLVVPGKPGFSTEGLQSLGIGMIAVVLNQAGHEVKVRDLTVQPLQSEEFGRLVQQFDPEFVGFTVVTPTANRVYHSLVPEVYQHSNARIVVGGPHPTALPDEALQHVDYVVRGEGEETILELCTGKNPQSMIPGLSYKEDGRPVHNPTRPLIKDLDTLPFPARHLFPPLTAYQGLPSFGKKVIGNLASSRGCVADCAFCDRAIFGRVFRARSAENVVAEWELLVKEHQAQVVTISDDNFTTSPGRIEKICTLLQQKGLHTIPWTCSNGIRVETASYDLLALMKRAGCCSVAFGIESGSQKVLDAMHKNITLEQIRRAVKNARQAGIATLTGFFMLGTPWDTAETMAQTTRFATELPLDYAQFAIATPYPGTRMFAEVKDFLCDVAYDDYGAHEGVVYFTTPHLGPDAVKAAFHKAYRSFYLRPALMLRHVQRVIRHPSTILTYLHGVKRFLA
ncbi:predicted Fe-S oxidoreductase [Candidatus Vecturithrix granuli]|uniref:Predicted Fe-S oxidoreductase n=1 Tax=Vecturithrix granuli TaxID=1499967 RepID=A0A081C017_VECG1|nr:predicted Fe-S oxidoreductase [Candidatus Vecturithrix granuli]